MNQYIYENLVKPYINNIDKKIFQKKDSYFITYHYSKKRKKNLLFIFLHLGYPCIRRYCACSFYQYDEILRAKNTM